MGDSHTDLLVVRSSGKSRRGFANAASTKPESSGVVSVGDRHRRRVRCPAAESTALTLTQPRFSWDLGRFCQRRSQHGVGMRGCVMVGDITGIRVWGGRVSDVPVTDWRRNPHISRNPGDFIAVAMETQRWALPVLEVAEIFSTSSFPQPPSRRLMTGAGCESCRQRSGASKIICTGRPVVASRSVALPWPSAPLP